jgi:hypothetical protein
MPAIALLIVGQSNGLNVALILHILRAKVASTKDLFLNCTIPRK